MQTATQTQTNTFARLELTKWQFHGMLVRYFPNENGEQVYKRVLAPAIEKKVLKSCTLAATDWDGLCHASLTLAVNWQRHKSELQKARLVTLKGKWVNRTAPQLRVMLEHFDEVVEKGQLRVGFHIRIDQDDELIATAQAARLRVNRRIRWASPKEEPEAMTIAQLPELSLVIAIAADWQIPNSRTTHRTDG